MSASVGSDRFELNLTPLLDVVMQLIMFFMMCVNFVSDQVNQNVVLPTSSSAQEIMPKTDVDVLVINLEVRRVDRKDATGNVIKNPQTNAPIKDLVTPKQTKIVFTGTTEGESKYFTDDREGEGIAHAQRALSRLSKDFRKKESLRSGKPLDKVEMRTVVVIRADSEVRYGLVVQLIAQCTKEGFPKVEVRALSQSL